MNALVASVTEADAQIGAIASRPHGGLTGLLNKVGDSRALSKATADRDAKAALLRYLLAKLAGSAPKPSLDDADALRSQAEELQAKAASLNAAASDAESQATSIAEEVSRRQAAIKQMGFDAPYLAAQFATSGPTPLAESALVTKRGETAYFQTGATLCRHRTKTSFVGRSQGISVPIGVMGIRYRVGGFRGHPVQQDVIARVDSGHLVITNQRLAFVGSSRSVVVPLAKVVHAEVYTDGMAILREGKEAADIYLFPNPRLAIFYLNWFLDSH